MLAVDVATVHVAMENQAVLELNTVVPVHGAGAGAVWTPRRVIRRRSSRLFAIGIREHVNYRS